MEKNNINLNENGKAITIAYSTKTGRSVKEYDFLVIACDPRNLETVCDFDSTEKEIFSQLQNFTFHTTLMTVPVTKAQEHGVVFAPNALEKMQGSVYGFRNESAKKFGLDISNTMRENLVAVYQLLGPEAKPFTPAEFALILERELPTLDWWPFGTQYRINDTVTTPYFDHFSADGLKAGKPWDYLGIQGLQKTFYVHASTCFESALDCWGYENMLLATGTNSRQALPADKSAAIAIIGAGVSGLLFAVKLKRLGYTNIEILESTDRYGGKTHTIKMDGPYPEGSNEPTYCELGTCYMSPAYKEMVTDLQEYLQGNEQIPFGEKVNRGIVTRGQLPPSFNAPLVMDNTKYVLRKAEAELGLNPGYFDDKLTQAELLEGLVKYIAIHWGVFGESFPMPASPPQSFLDNHADKTFLEFLRYHNLQGIVGILQYGYEVQGYGTLSNISAYYGLVWITPPIIEAMIEDAFGGNVPIVTAWSEGWGNLWTQIVEKERLRITNNVIINTIQRLDQ